MRHTCALGERRECRGVSWTPRQAGAPVQGARPPLHSSPRIGTLGRRTVVKNHFGLLPLLYGLCLFTAAPVGGRQLPPEVLLDQLLLRTERLIEADDFDAALEAMTEALALREEHGLELPAGFGFQRARVAFSVGLLGAAKESVTEYLTVSSREAESYLEAVELLEDVDRILERRNAPECTPEPDGSECWMELASHPRCYVWNPNPQPDETAAWSGECSAGFVQGPGILTWTNPEGSQEQDGNRRFGQPHDKSVIRDSDGGVHEGPYVFGKRTGRWIEKTADGAVLEGPYVNGEENGHWILKFADGQVEEGSFVDGKRNGQWVLRVANGGVHEGPYVDGERIGRWIDKGADGDIGEGPYVDGERNGRWILKYANGQVEEGPYVDGEQHGRWVVRPVDGETFHVTFVRGVRQER